MTGLRLGAVAALVFAGSSVAAAQQGAYRFELIAVADSTVTFSVADASWVKAGQRAIAVDPARHDVLVARLTVSVVTAGIATAVITGQTTPLTKEYVALIAPPPHRWYQEPAVWIGVVVGAAIGAIVKR